MDQQELFKLMLDYANNPEQHWVESPRWRTQEEEELKKYWDFRKKIYTHYIFVVPKQLDANEYFNFRRIKNQNI